MAAPPTAILSCTRRSRIYLEQLAKELRLRIRLPYGGYDPKIAAKMLREVEAAIAQRRREEEGCE